MSSLFKKIDGANFNELAPSLQLCQLPFSVLCIEKKLGEVFFDYIEPGLGNCYGLYVSSEKSKYFFMGAIDKENIDLGVTVFIRSYDLNPKQCLIEICEGFQLNPSDLMWKNDDLDYPKWIVFYKENNGYINELHRFQTEQVANSYCQIHDGDEKKLSYKKID